MLELGAAHLSGLVRGTGKENLSATAGIEQRAHTPPDRSSQSEESSTISVRGRGGGVDLFTMT
jgi:hypothetical protein